MSMSEAELRSALPGFVDAAIGFLDRKYRRRPRKKEGRAVQITQLDRSADQTVILRFRSAFSPGMLFAYRWDPGQELLEMLDEEASEQVERELDRLESSQAGFEVDDSDEDWDDVPHPGPLERAAAKLIPGVVQHEYGVETVEEALAHPKRYVRDELIDLIEEPLDFVGAPIVWRDGVAWLVIDDDEPAMSELPSPYLLGGGKHAWEQAVAAGDPSPFACDVLLADPGVNGAEEGPAPLAEATSDGESVSATYYRDGWLVREHRTGLRDWWFTIGPAVADGPMLPVPVWAEAVGDSVADGNGSKAADQTVWALKNLELLDQRVQDATFIVAVQRVSAKYEPHAARYEPEAFPYRPQTTKEQTVPPLDLAHHDDLPEARLAQRFIACGPSPTRIVITPQGEHAQVACHDGLYQIDLQTWRCEPLALTGGPVTDLVVVPRVGVVFATQSGVHQVTGTELIRLHSRGEHLASVGDSGLAIAGPGACGVVALDLSDGAREQWSVELPQAGPLAALADGRIVVSSGPKQLVVITADGQQVTELDWQPRRRESIQDIAASPDGLGVTVATADGEGGTIHNIELGASEPQISRIRVGWPGVLSWHPTGRYLLAGDSDGFDSLIVVTAETWADDELMIACMPAGAAFLQGTAQVLLCFENDDAVAVLPDGLDEQAAKDWGSEDADTHVASSFQFIQSISNGPDSTPRG